MIFIVSSGAMPARKISEILDEAPALRNLAAVSRELEQLQRCYVEALPIALSRASRVGWARSGVLSVTANNGAVAAKLRQLAPRVLDHMGRRGLKFNSMRIEVQVAAQAQAVPRGNPKRLTGKAISAIDKAVEQTQESPLKHALVRLARHR